MKWNKIKATKAKKTPSNSGSWCIFVPLSKTEGVKFYHTEKIRDEAAKLQGRAHKVGLGPKVGGKCEMPLMAGWHLPCRVRETPKRVYGYITQLVDIGTFPEIREYERFEKKCLRHGISTRDMTMYSNCGYLPNGKLVRYDFDPVFYHAS